MEWQHGKSQSGTRTGVNKLPVYKEKQADLKVIIKMSVIDVCYNLNTKLIKLQYSTLSPPCIYEHLTASCSCPD